MTPSPTARYCNRAVEADTEEIAENDSMKNWLCILVLVSFIRLQFVCCGSVEHWETHRCTCHTSAEPAKVKSVCHCCDLEAEQQASSSTDSARPNAVERIEASTACDCQYCTQDHSHLPHLFAARHLLAAQLRSVSSPRENIESLVAQQALPIIAVASSECNLRPRFDRLNCLYKDVSILCQFGQLRI